MECFALVIMVESRPLDAYEILGGVGLTALYGLKAVARWVAFTTYTAILICPDCACHGYTSLVCVSRETVVYVRSSYQLISSVSVVAGELARPAGLVAVSNGE